MQIEDHLDIHATGDVSGELTYGKLSVASGGRLAGSIGIVPRSTERDAAGEPSRSNGVHGTAEPYPVSSFA
jgi:cytoskeletal protein CcmA (bactofilin family)